MTSGCTPHCGCLFVLWRREQREKRKKNETVFGWCFSTELQSANTRRLRTRARNGGRRRQRGGDAQSTPRMFSAQNIMIDNRYLALWSTTCPHLSMQRLLALAPRSACSALQLRLFSAASEGAKANLSKKAAAPNSAAASLTKPVSPPSASFKPSVVASAPALQSDASARDLLSAVAASGVVIHPALWH